MRHFRLLGPIDQSTSEAFVSFLDSLAVGEPYGLEINSPGGVVSASQFMANKMAVRPPEHAYIHQAGSAATLIAMAAKRIVMSRSGHMMLHQPQMAVEGSADQLRQASEFAKDLEKEFVKVYAKRSGATQASIIENMQSQKPLDATEAHKLGLVDEILDAAEMVAHINTKETRMGFKEIVARLLNLPTAELKEDKGEPTADTVKLLEAKICALEADKKAAVAQVETEAVAAIMSQALASGRLTAHVAGLDAIKALDSHSLQTLVDSMPVSVPVSRIETKGLVSPVAIGFTPEQVKMLNSLGVKAEDVANKPLPVATPPPVPGNN